MRLTASGTLGTASRTSSGFTVDLAGLTRTIAVNGRVLDAASRAAISGATVTLAGQSRSTGVDGKFSFASVSLASGSTLAVSKSGYSTFTGTVPVPAGAQVVTVPDVLMGVNDPTKPAVTGIQPKYDGLFLSGASIMNQYTATVDWNGKAPSAVEFYVNGSLKRTVTTSTTEATADIDMKLGFVGSLTLGANKISAVAVSGDGVRSPMFDQPVSIIPMPAFLVDQALLLPFEFIPGNEPAISWEFNFPRSIASASDVRQIPFIGNLGPKMSFDVAFDYEIMSGEWGLFAGKEWEKRIHSRSGRRPNVPKFYFGNVDINWGFGGGFEGRATQTQGVVVERVKVELSAGVRMEILSFYCTDYLPGGQLVRFLDYLKKVGVDVNSIQRVRVDGLLDASLSAYAKLSPLSFDEAVLNIKPGVEAIYEPNVGIAHGKIAVGGNLGLDLQLAPKFGLDKITGAIYLDLHFEAWGFDDYDENLLIVSGTLYERSAAAGAMVSAEGEPVKAMVGDEKWVVYRVTNDSSKAHRREYLKAGPERFVAGESRLVRGKSGKVSTLESFNSIGQSSKGVARGKKQGPSSNGPQEGPLPTSDQEDLALVENVNPGSFPSMARGAYQFLRGSA